MELSLVIPVYNEEENLRPLYNEIRQVMDENFGDYEVIFVDDGSTDSSLEVLNSIQQKDPNVKILEFEGNFWSDRGDPGRSGLCCRKNNSYNRFRYAE